MNEFLVQIQRLMLIVTGWRRISCCQSFKIGQLQPLGILQRDVLGTVNRFVAFHNFLIYAANIRKKYHINTLQLEISVFSFINETIIPFLLYTTSSSVIVPHEYCSDFLADNIGQSFSAFQCIGRTNLSTSLTQDAFRGVFALTGVVASLYIHRTHFKAFAALDTLVLITMNT